MKPGLMLVALLPVFLLTFLPALPARAGLPEGKQYLRAGAWPQALIEFNTAAGQGSPAAAYYLGLMHKNGLGVARDSVVAARHFETAAQGGIAAAMFVLANMLLAGDGVAVDEDAARRWNDRAADMDYPEAVMQRALGLANGSMGYLRDDAEAQQQMKAAAHAMTHRPEAP